jgi:hypothetical protein
VRADTIALACGLHERATVNSIAKPQSAKTRCIAAALALGVSGCVEVPESPEARDLSALYDGYEHPTAVIPEALVRSVFDVAATLVGPARILSGLSFTRDRVSEANTGLAQQTSIDDFEVSGRVDASSACPGDGLTISDDGRVDAVFGVSDSHLHRAFSGTLDACRFQVVSSFGETQHVVLTSRFAADLGVDLRIGDPLPRALLIELDDVQGTILNSLGPSDIPRRGYHVRLVDDGAVEVLIDSITTPSFHVGSLVVVLWPNGSIGLRESSGSWRCGEPPEPCVLTP